MSVLVNSVHLTLVNAFKFCRSVKIGNYIKHRVGFWFCARSTRRNPKLFPDEIRTKIFELKRNASGIGIFPHFTHFTPEWLCLSTRKIGKIERERVRFTCPECIVCGREIVLVYLDNRHCFRYPYEKCESSTLI